ncbi:hypothetical protein L7F22_045168, partial [Adiantum nelumboides]|nr:hypothetical protein [Adiantum nelumboides]
QVKWDCSSEPQLEAVRTSSHRHEEQVDSLDAHGESSCMMANMADLEADDALVEQSFLDAFASEQSSELIVQEVPSAAWHGRGPITMASQGHEGNLRATGGKASRAGDEDSLRAGDGPRHFATGARHREGMKPELSLPLCHAWSVRGHSVEGRFFVGDGRDEQAGKLKEW